MDYKTLNTLLPKELIIYIGYYDNTSKQKMDRVIKELDDFKEKVLEYESWEKMLYYLDDWQLSHRQKHGLSIETMDQPILFPYLKLNSYIHHMISNNDYN